MFGPAGVQTETTQKLKWNNQQKLTSYTFTENVFISSYSLSNCWKTAENYHLRI